MNNQLNIFERLRAGVKIETLSTRDCEIINELYSTGNEQIMLSSENLEITDQIEQAIPFSFELKISDGTAVLTVYPDPPPSFGKPVNPNYPAWFAFTNDVLLKWI